VENWQRFGVADELLAANGLSCLGAGSHTGVGAVRGRRLESYALVVVAAGSGWYEDRHVGRVELVAPAVIRLFPGRLHGYGSDRAGWSERWILFDGALARAMEETGLLDRRTPAVPLPALPTGIEQRFAELRGALEGDAATARLAAAAQCQLVVSACAGEDPRRSAAERTVDALRRDAALPLSVADRARRLGLSGDALRERARLAAGSSPHEVVVAARIERAASLLAGTALPVQEVARRVGYEDPAYFSRLFTRRTGTTPSRFRERFGRRDG
jgi:AraC-like DNA-binding protein